MCLSTKNLYLSGNRTHISKWWILINPTCSKYHAVHAQTVFIQKCLQWTIYGQTSHSLPRKGKSGAPCWSCFPHDPSLDKRFGIPYSLSSIPITHDNPLHYISTFLTVVFYRVWHQFVLKLDKVIHFFKLKETQDIQYVDVDCLKYRPQFLPLDLSYAWPELCIYRIYTYS